MMCTLCALGPRNGCIIDDGSYKEKARHCEPFYHTILILF